MQILIQKLLIEQAKKFQPESVSIVDEDAYLIVKDALKNTSIDVLCGKNGLLEISSRDDVDLVLNALVGSVWNVADSLRY